MRTETFFSILVSISLAGARPLAMQPQIERREVPQEHSHEQFLTTVRTSLSINNPAGITDPVFGLLGNAAAAGGQGKITDTDCLQQATADQAFTNAKAANDVAGMTAALIYRALERNTGKVGLVSNPCASIKAANPEIGALSQHQDPASSGAAAANKAITLELAKQIASIGGNATEAINSGTFAPGSTSDNTGKGNGCDDANDPIGCIFTQNLLVPDVTADEIANAVGGGAITGTASGTSTGVASSTNSSDTTASAASTDNSNSSSSTLSTCPATTNSTNPSSSSPLSLGSCTDPSIVFGPNFDGRTEESFESADKNDFNHGSADNIGVITSFICQQLQDKCKASSTATAACAQGSTAAGMATKGQAQADAFNAVFT